MIRPDFLTPEAQKELTKLAKNAYASHGEGRQANALLLLNKGMSCQEVARVLFIDDDTARYWYKLYMEDGIPGLARKERSGGGTSLLTSAQKEETKQWVKKKNPASIREVGTMILQRYGIDYKSRSGLQYLLKSLGLEYRKPKPIPKKIDEEKQEYFINKYDTIQNNLAPDEMVVFGDAVHPTYAVKVRGCWAEKGEKLAIQQTSGREHLNIHGAVDLETGKTYMLDVLTVNFESTIALLESIEKQNPDRHTIHVIFDNASYHHSRKVKEWIAQPGRRIKIHFIPSYCPHLNPIERFWGIMHKNVTYNRSYAKFREFCSEVLNFLRIEVPKKWNEFCESVTDNFRVIRKGDFRVVA